MDLNLNEMEGEEFSVSGALKQVLSQVAGLEPEEETQRKINSILEKYNQMSFEEKSNFERHLKSVVSDSLMKGFSAGVQQAVEKEIAGAYAGFLLFVVVVAILVFVFVFFGYKLYKSIKEKELKKEEKKLAKQMKKKK